MQPGQTYDAIVENVGMAPLSRSQASLRERGRLPLIVATLPDWLRIPWVLLTSNKKILAGVLLPPASTLLGEALSAYPRRLLGRALRG